MSVGCPHFASALSVEREAPPPRRRNRAPNATAPTAPGAPSNQPAAAPLAPRAPTPLQNFEGLDVYAGGGWVPPDPNGDVGPNHYIQAVNIALGIYSKTGTQDCVPQLGTTQRVDALGDRLIMQLQYRNFWGVESLWANHTLATNSAVGYPTGVRWYEIRNPNGSPTVYQQGTFRPDSNYRWLGSLAVDREENMALGYSESGTGMYPAILYTGRMVTDPLGQLSIGETSLIEGTGSQTGSNRWGDYSAMTIDLCDDLTFWYTNEYFSTISNIWHTRIGSFRLGSAPAPPIPRPYVYYFSIVAKNYSSPCN